MVIFPFILVDYFFHLFIINLRLKPNMSIILKFFKKLMAKGITDKVHYNAK
jgi:hypothetical protein